MSSFNFRFSMSGEKRFTLKANTLQCNMHQVLVTVDACDPFTAS